MRHQDEGDIIISSFAVLSQMRQLTAESDSTLGKARSRPRVPRVGAKRAPRSGSEVDARARELLMMAAHDLRSPLAAIGLRSHSVLRRWRAGEKPPCEEWASVVLGICAAVKSASSMIDDVLAMERLDQTDRRTRHAAVIDVLAVIDEAIEHERLPLERARCPVTVRKDGLASARGAWDRPYLLRVFGNVLRNAAQHAAGAPILITLVRRGDRLGIVFSDSGPGLAEHWRPGDLVGNSRRDPNAQSEVHGLGLWIVRRAIERLQGRLKIRSRTGVGLMFDIELPGLEP